MRNLNYTKSNNKIIWIYQCYKKKKKKHSNTQSITIFLTNKEKKKEKKKDLIGDKMRIENAKMWVIKWERVEMLRERERERVLWLQSQWEHTYRYC